MTLDLARSICTQALGTPILTRTWIASLLLHTEEIDRDWRLMAVRRLLQVRGEKILFQVSHNERPHV